MDDLSICMGGQVNSGTRKIWVIFRIYINPNHQIFELWCLECIVYIIIPGVAKSNVGKNICSFLGNFRDFVAKCYVFVC